MCISVSIFLIVANWIITSTAAEKIVISFSSNDGSVNDTHILVIMYSARLLEQVGLYPVACSNVTSNF